MRFAFPPYSSVTSGTIFHSCKRAIRDHLAVIALWANGVKGVSALQISRDMDVSRFLSCFTS
jgi:hypothetical protein